MPVGTTLQSGKYRIESHLASGGFGNTYKAKNLFFEEIVAIKEFYMKGVTHRDAETQNVSVSNSDNEPMFIEQKEKFLKEARRIYKLSKLGCGHIVDVKDFFEENGTAYYVMGYIEGESLSKKVKEAEPCHRLPQREVYGYVMQILDALEVVHDKKLFHLDLKPGNVMVDGQGKAMLIDFGASKQTNPDNGEATRTALCYTPGYAPLEQMEQDIDSLGAWTDLYSLGATVYYLLTGKTPPKPLKLIQEGDGALKFPDDVVPGMRDLVVRLMKPNRMDRFQSVDEVRSWMAKNIKKPEKLPDVVSQLDNDETMVITSDFIKKKAEQERKERQRREKEERARIEQERKEKEEQERKEKEEQERKEKEERIRKEKEERVRKEREESARKEQLERERRERAEREPAVIVTEENEAGKGWKDLLLSKTSAIVGAAAIVAFLLGAVGLKKCSSSSTEGPEPPAVAQVEVPEASSVAVAVEKMKGGNNLGEYLYTGTVDADSLPHGMGEAVFTSSATAKSYKGPFVHGVMEGPDAEYVFLNGDTFTGTFKNGHFEEGKLTTKTGESYVGKFGEDGQPLVDEKGNLEGTMYDKDGNKI